MGFMNEMAMARSFSTPAHALGKGCLTVTSSGTWTASGTARGNFTFSKGTAESFLLTHHHNRRMAIIRTCGGHGNWMRPKRNAIFVAADALSVTMNGGMSWGGTAAGGAGGRRRTGCGRAGAGRTRC
jgi:hypothetical protein